MGHHFSNEIETNQGVRKGCSLSPSLFNISLDEIVRSWMLKAPPGIYLNSLKSLNILMFADDPVVIQDSEYSLLLAIHNEISNTYKINISTHQTKTMAFFGESQYALRFL